MTTNNTPRFYDPNVGLERNIYSTTSEIGGRNTGIKGASTNHKGKDFGTNWQNRPEGIKGAPIPAAADGKIAFSGVIRGYGNCVVIEHHNDKTGEAVYTFYAHMDKSAIENISNGKNENGEAVHIKTGELIGTVGNTNGGSGVEMHPHLHMEIRTGIPKDANISVSTWSTYANGTVQNPTTYDLGPVRHPDPSFGQPGITEERAIDEQATHLQELTLQFQASNDDAEKAKLSDEIANTRQGMVALETTRQGKLDEREQLLSSEKISVTDRLANIATQLEQVEDIKTGTATPQAVATFANTAGLLDLSTEQGRHNAQVILKATLDDSGAPLLKGDVDKGTWGSDMQQALGQYYTQRIAQAPNDEEKNRLQQTLNAIEQLPTQQSKAIEGLGRIDINLEMAGSLDQKLLIAKTEDVTTQLTNEQAKLKARLPAIAEGLKTVAELRPNQFARALENGAMREKLLDINQQIANFDTTQIAPLTALQETIKNYQPIVEEGKPNLSAYEAFSGQLAQHQVHISHLQLPEAQRALIPDGYLKPNSDKKDIEIAQQFLYEKGCYGDKTFEEVVTGKWDNKIDGVATLKFQQDYSATQIQSGIPTDQVMSVDNKTIDTVKIGYFGKEMQEAMALDNYAKTLSPTELSAVVEGRKTYLEHQEKAHLTNEQSELTNKINHLESNNGILMEAQPRISSIAPNDLGQSATLSPLMQGINNLQRLATAIQEGNQEAAGVATATIRSSDTGMKFASDIEQMRLTTAPVDPVVTTASVDAPETKNPSVAPSTLRV